MKSGLLLITSSTLAFTAVPSAHAQMQAEAPQGETAQSFGIEEIVVTAQKRAQNVQDVPIAISAFAGDSLKERAVANVSSLSNISPNVTLDAGSPFSGSSSVLSAYVRGIGQSDFAANFDPGVGVYLDGVYLARTVGANLDLPDVQRIEVLKGPQGTLFGRNTIGGAISIVTRDPGKEFSFRGDVTTGRYNRLDINASVDLPVSDNLALALTGSSRNRDGYLKRIPFPGANNYINDPDLAFRSNGIDRSSHEGGQSQWSLRGKAYWTPTDRLTIRLTGDYLHEDQQGTANTIAKTTASDPSTLGFLYNTCINTPSAVLSTIGLGNLCASRGTPLNPSELIGSIAGVNVDGDPTNDRLTYDDRFIPPSKDTSYATGINFSRMTAWGIATTLDYKLNDNFALKSITGYRDLDWGTGLDADGSPVRLLEFSFGLTNWQFSQELQLTGQLLNDRLKFVIGGYYFKEHSKLNDYVTFDQGIFEIFGPNDLKTKNFAFFGQADFELNDLISFTLGGRYTEENKSFLGGQTDLNGFYYKISGCTTYGDPCSSTLGFPDPNQPLRFFVDQRQKRKFTNFAPKLGVQLHPTRDVMVYGSWSKGYKTGGWTTRLSAPLNFAPKFNPEKAESFEVGVKSQLFDRRLQINAAAFTTKYRDIQLNFQLGISPTIQNAGDARIKGFEVEVVAAPIPGLTVNSSVGYTDAYYTDVLVGAAVAPNPIQAGVYVGAPLPKTPKLKFNVSPRYEYKLPGGGSLIALVDYTRTSSVWNDTERAYLLRRPASDTLNASLSYKAASGNWTATVGGTNLTNDRYYVTGNVQAAGVIFGTYNRPVEWYARLGVEF
ncbi:TonB-dependent receptor [Sphingobium fluviale]|uniref:TonB-dependent receptor n=1 Tax=Sphingobium fluviale TaxID=2506423 RepID=A0A4Q1KM16_9SPHN|nr:TonB-dependent receptor [Sphingobium fluviale]RXR30470.1 TonB-dependent receptor [Sphingobium fluviale]